jgi:hypothetical protein
MNAPRFHYVMQDGDSSGVAPPFRMAISEASRMRSEITVSIRPENPVQQRHFGTVRRENLSLCTFCGSISINSAKNAAKTLLFHSGVHVIWLESQQYNQEEDSWQQA